MTISFIGFMRCYSAIKALCRVYKFISIQNKWKFHIKRIHKLIGSKTVVHPLYGGLLIDLFSSEQWTFISLYRCKFIVFWGKEWIVWTTEHAYKWHLQPQIYGAILGESEILIFSFSFLSGKLHSTTENDLTFW